MDFNYNIFLKYHDNSFHYNILIYILNYQNKLNY